MTYESEKSESPEEGHSPTPVQKPTEYTPNTGSPELESRADSINIDPDHNDPEQCLGTELKTTQSNVLSRIASRLSRTSTVEPPPDGGRKAWLQCFCAWLVVFNTWGLTNSFGAFQTYYTSELALQASTVSWVGSIQVWILFFMSAFSGRALDAGYFIPTFALGAVIQLIGIFTTSVSTKFWQLLLSQGVATGIGSGIMFCPSMALCATYFSSHRGIAVALATTGNSAGGMIYPIIVTRLLPKVGFAWTVRVLGFLNLGCLIVVLCFMRPRLPPRVAGPLIEWSAFTELPYMLFVAGVFCSLWTLYFTFYYVASYGRFILGMSYGDAVNLLIIYNGIGIPARILSGYLADRYLGVLNTICPLVVSNAIIAYCWLAVPDTKSYFVYICFYGLLAAAFQSLFPTSIASLSPDIRKTGTRLGMAFTLLSFAGLTGPPIGGALLTTDGGGYLPAQIWAATSMLLAACFIVGARVSRYGTSLRIKC